MSHLSRRATAAVIAATSVVSLFGLASPASAKGGTPAPAPAPTPEPVLLECYGDLGPAYPNTPDIAINYAGAAGCVGVSTSGGVLRLAWVALNPGWRYEVQSSGGTDGGVRIQFTNASTGGRVDFRFEPGKTKVS
jgi:hypothetical protein